MTIANSIVPVALVDELYTLNSALEAYQCLITSWSERVLNGDIEGNPETFIMGVSLMFAPILDGYKSVHSQIKTAKRLGLQGATILKDLEG